MEYFYFWEYHIYMWAFWILPIHLLTREWCFPSYSSDIPTQLWIAGRLMEALSLFIILFLDNKQDQLQTHKYDIWFYYISPIIAIMVFKTFPVCFIEGEGLTHF